MQDLFKMGTESIKDPNCKHNWIKRKYEGLVTIATWEHCPKCNSERKRNVETFGAKKIEARLNRMAGF